MNGEGVGSSDIKIRAQNAGNNNITTDELDITIDEDTPSFNLESPSGYASSSSPSVEVSAEDSTSDLANITVYLLQDGALQDSTTCTDISGSTASCTLDPDSELENGNEYDVNATAYDSVGNKGTDTSMSFTVDTEYDGDSNPSFSIEGESGGLVTFDDDVDMDVDFDSADDTSETTATCVIGGEDVGSESFSSAADGTDFTCEIPHDDNEDYYDESAEVYIEIEDGAGNTAESDREDIIFDAESPTVSELGSVNDLSTFNSNFDAEFTAFDSASGVEEYEYYFNGNSGDGVTNDYEDGEFTVDLEGNDLESGENVLHVRVKDEAGRWSSSEIFEFEYFPNKDPKVSLTVPDNVSVTAGESEEFDVTVENTGEFLIESVNVEVESDLLSENDTVEDMEPSDSVTLDYEVDTSEDQIGEYSVDVSTEGPESSESFDVWVKANQDQQSSIESDLTEYEQKLQSLEANVSELEKSVSKEQSTRIASNMSEFRSDVESAREAVDSGEYYKAQSALNGIDSDFTKAKTSYENVEQEYQSSQRMKMILGGFAVLLLGGIGGVFVLNREDIIDVDEYIEQLKETAGDLDSGEGDLDLEGIKEKVSGIFSNKAEADEFEWDGFRD